MTKNFRDVEDVIADESFRAWYFQEDPRQVRAWEQWLSEHPGVRPLVDEAVEWMKNMPVDSSLPNAVETEQKLHRLHDAIADQQVRSKLISLQRRKKWGMVAAAILLLGVTTFSFWPVTGRSEKINTVYGETKTSTLPDGSTMILNANSQARLGSNWAEGKDREVWLDGEAYFHVTKTAESSRFIVHTKKMDVEVTGTSFNVVNRVDRHAVFLAEGSVTLLTKDGKSYFLKPGDFVELKGKVAERTAAREENVLAWKDNRLSFNNTPIIEVARIIKDHYGVNVRLGEDLNQDLSLTGILANDNLDVLLNAIEVAVNVRISRSDRSISITGKE